MSTAVLTRFHRRFYKQAVVVTVAIVLLRHAGSGASAADGDVVPKPMSAAPPISPWAKLQVVDAASGRGMPLVELQTVSGLKFVTDNASRVALLEPGRMDREVSFTVRAHGYEALKDGFGITGVRAVPPAGRNVRDRADPSQRGRATL